MADLGSLQRLPRIIGQGHTRELGFTGRDIDAERAQAIGLVNDVYDDREALSQAAAAMAQEIAANAPLTVRGVKDVLRFGEGKSVAEGLAYVGVWNSAFLASKDLGEAQGERPTDAPRGHCDETMTAVLTFPQWASSIRNLEKEDFLQVP